jgi:type IV pilus assembly protein PilV
VDRSALHQIETRATRTSHQKGATLIEALIALLVLSVGLLGMVALQLIGTKESASALRHSRAVWMARDMADRMRANPTGVEANHYDMIDTSTLPSSPPTCGAGANCTAQQIATYDTSQWGLLLQQLPGGTGMAGGIGTVTADSTVAGRFAVTVMWDDEGTGATGTACGSDPLADLTCLTIWVDP